MGKGRYRFVRQVGGRGAFAIVSLEVEPAGEFSVDLHPAVAIDARGRQSDYGCAARTGVQYAWESVGGNRSGPPVRVTITEITGMLADTSVMQVVYAAAMAMWEGLGRQPKNPIQIDATSSRSFQFPF